MKDWYLLRREVNKAGTPAGEAIIYTTGTRTAGSQYNRLDTLAREAITQ